MKVINLTYPINDELLKNVSQSVIAMGFFDGVHKGHQKVINAAKKNAQAKHLPLAVLTYDHHPALVYRKLDGDAGRYLTLWNEKEKHFKELGVDIVYRVNYDFAFQNQRPQAFVDNFLMKLKPDTVVAGFDHTYGKHNAGMKELPIYAKKRFNVVSVNPDKLDGIKISSSEIRDNLSHGHIETVNKLLGYKYENGGVVIHGYARGRELGFPTANIQYDNFKRLPEEGVYTVLIKVNQKWYGGMASIGRNITFGDNNPLTLEINIFDFNQNIYGNQVKVKWLTKMRDEVKYTTREALISQLRKDEDCAKNFIKNAKS